MTVHGDSAGAMNAAASQQCCDSLAYNLMLAKSSEDKRSPTVTLSADAIEDGSNEAASTATPKSDCSTASVDASPCCKLATVVTKADVVLIRNVAVHNSAGDDELAGLVHQARDLSHSAFGEDFSAAKKSGWKLSLLVSKDLSLFCGFVVAKVTKGWLSVAKVAVRSELRGCGLGKYMMNELMKAAKKQGDVFDVCLSALPEAVSFYKRLGFIFFDTGRTSATAQEDLVEGQVGMEKRLRQRPRRCH
jgi:ribosomal protein S18 acetylase RimI-like enzyme